MSQNDTPVISGLRRPGLPDLSEKRWVVSTLSARTEDNPNVLNRLRKEDLLHRPSTMASKFRSRLENHSQPQKSMTSYWSRRRQHLEALRAHNTGLKVQYETEIPEASMQKAGLVSVPYIGPKTCRLADLRLSWPEPTKATNIRCF